MAIGSFFGGGINPPQAIGSLNMAVSPVFNPSGYTQAAADINAPGTRPFSPEYVRQINSFLMGVPPALLTPDQYIFNPGPSAGMVFGPGGLLQNWTGLTPQEESLMAQYGDKLRRFEESKKKGVFDQFTEVVGDLAPLAAAALGGYGLNNLITGGAASAAGGAATAPTAAADVIGSDWAAGLAGTQNPGLLAGTAGYGGAAAIPGISNVPMPGAGGPLGSTGTSGLTPSLLDAGAYLNPISGGLATGGSVVPGAAGAGAVAGATAPYIPDVLSPFVGGNVGGVAPELGGTGVINNGSWLDNLLNGITGGSGGTPGAGNVASGAGDLLSGAGDLLGNLPSWLLPALGAGLGAAGTPGGGVEIQVPWNVGQLNELWDIGRGLYDQTSTPSPEEQAWFNQYMQSLGGAQQAVDTGLSNAYQAYQNTLNPSEDELLNYEMYMGGLGNAYDLMNQTMAGAYLTPDNPLYQSIFNDVTQQMGSMFYGADMTGPLQQRSAFAPAYSKEMSSQLAAQLFNPERNRMQQAAQIVPQLGQAGMQATNFMSQYPWLATNQYNNTVGNLSKITPVLGQAGQQATNFMQQYPWQAYGNLANATRPIGNASPYPGGNTAANALGGLVTGLALNRMV